MDHGTRRHHELAAPSDGEMRTRVDTRGDPADVVGKVDPDEGRVAARVGGGQHRDRCSGHHATDRRDLDARPRARADLADLVLRHGRHDAQVGRIESGQQRLAGRGHLAQFDVPCRHHARVRRDDRRVATRGRRLTGTRFRGLQLRIRDAQRSLGAIERRLAHELLACQIARALGFDAGVLVGGLRLCDLRLAARDDLGEFGLVDARDDLSLLHDVTDVVAEFDDAPRGLGGYRGLARRLDDGLGRVRHVDLAVLDLGRRERFGVRCGRMHDHQDGEQWTTQTSGHCGHGSVGLVNTR